MTECHLGKNDNNGGERKVEKSTEIKLISYGGKKSVDLQSQIGERKKDLGDFLRGKNGRMTSGREYFKEEDVIFEIWKNRNYGTEFIGWDVIYFLGNCDN